MNELETRAYNKGYAAARRAKGEDLPPALDQLRYECKSCGTKWYGPQLVPVWAGDGRQCGGSMEKVPPPPTAARAAQAQGDGACR